MYWLLCQFTLNQLAKIYVEVRRNGVIDDMRQSMDDKPSKIFKGCLLPNLLGPFMNKLAYIFFYNLLRSMEKWGLTRDGGLYHVDISRLVCTANHWTGFYMIGTFDIKKLKAARKIATVNLLCLWFSCQ